MDDRALLGDAPLGKLNGYRILVVDDDEEIRVFLTTLLSDEGAATFEASDGNQAIEKALSTTPDLITLDLSMPGKDGIETFCELRNDPVADSVETIAKVR